MVRQRCFIQQVLSHFATSMQHGARQWMVDLNPTQPCAPCGAGCVSARPAAGVLAAQGTHNANLASIVSRPGRPQRPQRRVIGRQHPAQRPLNCMQPSAASGGTNTPKHTTTLQWHLLVVPKLQVAGSCPATHVHILCLK